MCGPFYGETYPSISRWFLYKQHSWSVLVVKHLKLNHGLFFSSHIASFGLTPYFVMFYCGSFMSRLTFSFYDSINEISFTPYTPQNTNF